jgi:hypothetical protein
MKSSGDCHCNKVYHITIVEELYQNFVFAYHWFEIVVVSRYAV